MSSEVGPILERLDQTIGMLGQARFDVQVVNAAPDDIRQVLKHQIELMEWTLVPLVRTMAQDLQLSTDTWNNINELMERMKLVNQHFGHRAPKNLATVTVGGDQPRAPSGRPKPAVPSKPPSPGHAVKAKSPGSTQELPVVDSDIDQGWFE